MFTVHLDDLVQHCGNSFALAMELLQSYAKRLWPLLLTWFNFNPSMDK